MVTGHLCDASGAENFDDAVAVKPINADRGGFSACTENVVVRNTNVAFGVGMSIGSVPPHPGVNCVRNVTFENISYQVRQAPCAGGVASGMMRRALTRSSRGCARQHPIKAIYIKTDPGTKGTGIIDNITCALRTCPKHATPHDDAARLCVTHRVALARAQIATSTLCCPCGTRSGSGLSNRSSRARPVPGAASCTPS